MATTHPCWRTLPIHHCSVRAAIVDAVMDLQEVQWDEGLDDWEALADAARACSKDADQEAVRTAWEDMTVAKQAYSREFLVMCPRPDPSTAATMRPRRGGTRLPRPILKKPLNPILLPPSAFLLKEPKRARSASRTRRPTRESQMPPSRRGRNDKSLDNSRHRSRSFGPLLGRRRRGRGVLDSPTTTSPNDDMSSTLTATSTSSSSISSTTTSNSPLTVKKPTFSPLTSKGKIQLGNRPPTNSGGTNVNASPKSTVVNHNNTLYSFHVRKIPSPKQPKQQQQQIPLPKPKSPSMGPLAATVLRSPSQPKRRGGDAIPTPPSPSSSSVPAPRHHHALPRSPSPSQMLLGGRPKLSTAKPLLPPGPPPLVAVGPSSSSSSRRPRHT